jgi:hypothetical protein
MVAAIGRFALLAALLAAPAARADNLLPDWFKLPFSGGEPTTPQPSVRTPAQGATKESEKIVKLPANAAELDCPEVDIFDGGATARTGGPDSQSVRYQFDITDVARQCDPDGAQFALKIGVAGRLLIGPAGSPGSYSSSLHVVVKRQPENKPVFEKTIPVSVSTNGGVQAPFRVITDPVLLPLTRARLDDDYSITVGLGAGGAKAAKPRRTKHRG